MRRLLCILFLLPLCAVAANRPTVWISLQDLRFAGTLSNRTVTVTPAASVISGTNIVTRDRYKLTTDTNGVAVITNCAPGNYTLAIDGPDSKTALTLAVPDTNVTVYAYQHTTALTNSPTSSVAWSAAASDARYRLKGESALLLEGTDLDELEIE